MNVRFCGEQILSHDSEIVCAEVYHGPFLFTEHSKEHLDIDDTQSFIFK